MLDCCNLSDQVDWNSNFASCHLTWWALAADFGFPFMFMSWKSVYFAVIPIRRTACYYALVLVCLGVAHVLSNVLARVIFVPNVWGFLHLAILYAIFTEPSPIVVAYCVFPICLSEGYWRAYWDTLSCSMFYNVPYNAAVCYSEAERKEKD